MTPGYAVTAEGYDGPIAVFSSYEDALRWATLRFGADAFQIDEVLTRMYLPTPHPEPVPA
jgi:hypothetical protein